MTNVIHTKDCGCTSCRTGKTKHKDKGKKKKRKKKKPDRWKKLKSKIKLQANNQEGDWSKARKVHTDAGAFMTDDYKPESAYFTVLEDNGELLHETHNVGAVWAVEAEYRAIEWAIKQTNIRPLIVTNDNLAAISWAYKGANTKKHKLPPLIEKNVKVIHESNNLADIYNADNISPKQIDDKIREKKYANS